MKTSEMKAGYDFSRAKRGPIVPSSARKTRITTRIDTEVLNWFREQGNKNGGGNYQTLINDALRAYMQNQRGELLAAVRLAIRAELASAGVSKP